MAEGTDDQLARKGGFADTDPIQLIHEALAKLRFGGIQLTIQEGKFVQMDVTEKRRFT